MNDGFFNDAAPAWKAPLDQAWSVNQNMTPAQMADDYVAQSGIQQPTVPAPVVVAPAAAPAAPATRKDALVSALNNTYNGAQPITTTDANIASQVPYQDPIKGQVPQEYVVGGVTKSQSSGGTKLTAEAKQAAARAEAEGGKVADAQVAAGELASQNAAELSAMRDRQAAELQTQAQADLAKQDAIRQRVDDTMAQQQRDTDEYLKAASGIDPNRLMRGGRGVMAAIASGLGAFGAALTHSENSAQHIIDNAIQRDWQAQKDAADTKRYKSEATGKLVQQLRQTLSDEQSVQLAHHAAVREAMADQFDALALKTKGTEAAANATVLAGKQRELAAQSRAELLAREQIHSTNTVQTQIVPFSRTNSAMSVLDAAAHISDQQHKIAQNHGLLAEGPDREEAKEVKKEVAQSMMQLRPLSQFRDELKGALAAGLDQGWSMNSAKRNQQRLMVSDTLGRMRSGGAITEDEVNNFNKMIFGGSLDVSSGAIDELTRRYGDWLMGNARTRVNMLHPQIRDQVWSEIENATTPAEARQLKAGKFDNADEKAAQYGGAVRNSEPTRQDKVKAAVGERFGGRLDNR